MRDPEPIPNALGYPARRFGGERSQRLPMISMPTEPVYLRFENTSPPHNKFYEVEVELSFFYPKLLFRRWGRIGTRRPRFFKMMMADSTELQREVASLTKRRQQRGYRQVTEIRTPMLDCSAA